MSVFSILVYIFVLWLQCDQDKLCVPLHSFLSCPFLLSSLSLWGALLYQGASMSCPIYNQRLVLRHKLSCNAGIVVGCRFVVVLCSRLYDVSPPHLSMWHHRANLFKLRSLSLSRDLVKSAFSPVIFVDFCIKVLYLCKNFYERVVVQFYCHGRKEPLLNTYFWLRTESNSDRWISRWTLSQLS